MSTEVNEPGYVYDSLAEEEQRLTWEIKKLTAARENVRKVMQHYQLRVQGKIVEQLSAKLSPEDVFTEEPRIEEKLEKIRDRVDFATANASDLLDVILALGAEKEEEEEKQPERIRELGVYNAAATFLREVLVKSTEPAPEVLEMAIKIYQGNAWNSESRREVLRTHIATTYNRFKMIEEDAFPEGTRPSRRLINLWEDIKGTGRTLNDVKDIFHNWKVFLEDVEQI